MVKLGKLTKKTKKSERQSDRKGKGVVNAKKEREREMEWGVGEERQRENGKRFPVASREEKRAWLSSWVFSPVSLSSGASGPP